MHNVNESFSHKSVSFHLKFRERGEKNKRGKNVLICFPLYGYQSSRIFFFFFSPILNTLKILCIRYVHTKYEKSQINKVALVNRFIQMTVMGAYPCFSNHFLQRETTFVTSCCQTSISKVGAALKRENFLPLCKFFLF